MSTYKAQSAEPIENIAQLREAFVPLSPVEGRAGVEWELLPLDKKGHMAAYAGSQGVERLLGRLALKGFEPVMERGRIIALEIKNKGMIALEPGAQIEIASRPSRRLDELDRFFKRVHGMARAEARPLGFDLFPWGLAPNDGPEATKDVPKARYAILKKHLEASGDRGWLMMKLSAATQISMDYMDEAHLRNMVDGCMKLIPYLIALTANSPAANGKRSRWMSLRAPVWRRTDPKRCGLPPHLFSKGLSYDSLVCLPLVVGMAALLKGLVGRVGGFGWASRMQPPTPASVRRELLNAARLGSKWRPEAGPEPKAAWAELLNAAEEGLEAFDEPPFFLDPLRVVAGSISCSSASRSCSARENSFKATGGLCTSRALSMAWTMRVSWEY